ncbi:NAD(P)-binding domain-containing protein [Corynebacterium sp. 3HC-13]|uniref:NAD(P)/FAD-dependent oxidoreductase n=1 Tax=Corynebacterium poyangense TaxID=2684405 RepID=UPI001CCBB161|nr:NAD(P)/FAD-dependent oxidoreductase [Corynebacterium poyangense]MBZ8176450.1 NAD(P)-binding domain-containing protein [Corynebacterium poyangense]
MPSPHPLDVIVIGAGPAGIGTALACQAIDDMTVGVVEAGEIGNSFLHWHHCQTMLTPSFTSNGYGALDLNAIHPLTSPAFTLHTDYPTGEEYALYLRSLVNYFELPVLTNTEVTAITVDKDGIFHLNTAQGPAAARHLVWAGGEYHHPLLPHIPGRDHCDHSSSLHAWARHEGKGHRIAIIGGYESGIEMACHHAEHGMQVWLFDAAQPWENNTADPSISLAPRTRRRLQAAHQSGLIHPIAHRVDLVEKQSENYVVTTSQGQQYQVDYRPIAATGYGAGLGPADQLFKRRADGWPLVTENDESTITPNLFLNGPVLRHDQRHFCFIYKFRQRCAYLAEIIAQRLGHDSSGLNPWRDKGMIIDDLDCCGTECTC